ncbi:ATP-binding cassette domain-containing protein [candidate division KSB1 bacterium]|nr:ATP-binding cassette domain-containing protein [candidate division KSB1 bacterium]
MIRIEDLYFTYLNSERGIFKINLEINRNEFIAIIGSNGSGKTTLARCLNGLIIPCKGRVLVDGLDTGDSQEIFEIRRRVGMVFQNPDNQIVSATVEREIAFGLENIGIPTREMIMRVERMLQQFDLQKLRKKSPHYLSGGEKQRLALASVMAMEPRYLVLDEPTSLLDPRARKEIMQTCKRMSEEMTVVLITQFPEEALMADRLLIMHQGNLFADDHPAALFSRFDLMRKLGLEPPMQFKVENELHKSGLI